MGAKNYLLLFHGILRWGILVSMYIPNVYKNQKNKKKVKKDENKVKGTFFAFWQLQELPFSIHKVLHQAPRYY